MIRNLVKYIYSILKRLKFVRRLRYSETGWFLYFSLFRKVKRRVQEEKEFYDEVLKDGKGLLAFDIGANLGINTSHFLALGYRVIAVEPEKENFESLEIRYKNNHKVSLVKTAISDMVGQSFLEIEEGNALHTLSEKWKSSAQEHFQFDVSFVDKQPVETTTLDELIDRYGKPELLKVDVEGHEYQVFCGLSMPIPMIIFESNLPAFCEETIKIVEKLRSLDSRYRFSFYFEGKIEPFREDKISGLPDKTSIEIICEIDKND